MPLSALSGRLSQVSSKNCRALASTRRSASAWSVTPIGKVTASVTTSLNAGRPTRSCPSERAPRVFCSNSARARSKRSRTGPHSRTTPSAMSR